MKYYLNLTKPHIIWMDETLESVSSKLLQYGDLNPFLIIESLKCDLKHKWSMIQSKGHFRSTNMVHSNSFWIIELLNCYQKYQWSMIHFKSVMYEQTLHSTIVPNFSESRVMR